jgi:hypothetical protein
MSLTVRDRRQDLAPSLFGPSTSESVQAAAILTSFH